MGRKRWWKGSLELLVLCFLQRIVYGDGEVGCLFSKNVCRSGVETCYDDAAFGRCIQAFGELDDEDVYRYDLNARELELLRRQLESLVVDGYEWTHPYTQCVMQSSLYNLRYKLKRESELCQELRNIDESSLNEYGDDEESDTVNSQPLAVVNFTPIRGHGYGDFANEKYYPPESSKKPKHHNSHQSEKNEPENDYTYAYSSFRKKPKNHRISKFNNKMEDSRNNDEVLLMEKPDDSMNADVNLNDLSKKFRELSQRLNVKYEEPIYRLRRQPIRWNDNTMIGSKSLKIETPSKIELKDIATSDNDDKFEKMAYDQSWKNLKLDKNIWNFMRMNNSIKRDEDSSGIQSFSKNEPLHFFTNSERQDAPASLDNDEAEDGQEENDEKNEKLIINSNDNDEEFQQNDNEEAVSQVEEAVSQVEEAVSQVEESLSRLNNQRKTSGMYTEGGFVQPIELDDVMRQVSGPDDIVLDDDDINKLLWNRNLAAFQRPERVDVKKPGPLYSTNNYAFKTQLPLAPIGIVNGQNLVDEMSLENYDEKVARSPHVKKTYSEVNYNGQIYENVDTDHLYIQFNNEFTKWSEGEKVVEEVAKLLDMSPDSFSDIRVGRAEVTFRVQSEPDDAVAIAPKIAGIREELEKVTGMEVVCAGIGDKVKLPPTFNVKIASKPMSPGLFGATVAAGGAAAAAAAVVILVIARKHAKSRAKLAGLATPDPEASKDYQDLCRARMQAKQPTENKPESPRIISLSRESESNRSSTSSWGEEAAALTNMDIATGHMVLTYMEDHLKNKDRLDQEWAGICAYEADPSSVKIASEKLNADRNRLGSSLPYDHSRVVLNDLSNANNSDYINASTITDHDPRNPAYIATQGPLPQTSADFWQLVWEQGSVVIVMLTRLTEEGRGMCHRYWPEEGSELYHIYEVHLVSEHIWCDDYLVRSFYLKNLRTGETRTVTQFHFLSWPEHGVPQSTKALLEFRRKVNKSYRGRSCPIVVHCSDGAGRTGTYCLIDMVLNRMAKGAKEIDIAAALEHIRDQRPGMVATKQQFEFVLVAVAEEVHAILKALPVQTLSEKSQISNVAVTPASASQSSSVSDQ